MINIIMILGLVHYALAMINPKRSNILGCGIFGWAGKTPTKFRKSKLDILGIYNEKRGTDSCGVTSDGEIYIGTASKKVYKDFLSLGDYLSPKTLPVVFGHTRNSSKGAINDFNAHPFGFGAREDQTFEFIGVHNGTLHNADDLAKEFNVEEKVSTGPNSTRFKIDSEILLESIYNSKSFKVLNKYQGGAALVFTNTNEPNVIYCYKGASKLKHDDNDGKMFEERPLFYWREGKYSLYISSLEESLIAIGGTKSTVAAFDHNTVYKITNGDIEKAEKIKINRSKSFQNKKHSYGGTYTSPTLPANNTNSRVKPLNRAVNNSQTTLNLNGASDSKIFNIYSDDSRDVIDGNIYVEKLRYRRNGHLIADGVYTYIPSHGFYVLGDSLKTAERTLHYLAGKEFLDGDFVSFSPPLKNAFIPFTLVALQETTNIESYFYYFYKGIRLKSYRDLAACVDREKLKAPFNYIQLSNASCHPIIDTTVDRRPYDKQSVMLDGELYTGSYSMLGSNKIYHVHKGNCMNIETVINAFKKHNSKIKGDFDTTVSKSKSEKGTKEEVITVHQLNEVTDMLKANEIAISKENQSNDLLDKDINEMFLQSYKDFPLHIKRLKRYGDNKEALNAIKILETFVDSVSSIIAIDYNH